MCLHVPATLFSASCCGGLRTHLCCTSLGECYVTIWVLVRALSFELSGQHMLVLCVWVRLSVRNMCYVSAMAEPENTDQRQTHIYQAAIGRSPGSQDLLNLAVF